MTQRRRAALGPGNQVLVAIAHARGSGLRAWIRHRAEAFLDALGLTGVELSLSLVSDRAIRRINREWRAKDEATDVLSFPAGEPPASAPGPRPLGDVVISLDTAARQAREEGVALRAEVARYLAHGLLHLLGHDHHRPGPARRMARWENQLLGMAGMIERSKGRS